MAENIRHRIVIKRLSGNQHLDSGVSMASKANGIYNQTPAYGDKDT